MNKKRIVNGTKKTKRTGRIGINLGIGGIALLLFISLSGRGVFGAEQEKKEEIFSSASDYAAVYKRIFQETPARQQEVMEKLNQSYGAAVNESAVSDSAMAKAEAVSAASGYGGSGGGSSYSQTNVRTEGVDEGDTVKTDGSYIYTVSQSGILRTVSARDGELKLEGTMSLENLTDSIVEMYVDKDLLCLITTGYETSLKEEKKDQYSMSSKNLTRLYTYDISDKKKPVLKGMVTQEGSYEASRKSGDYVYLFSRYYAGNSEEISEDKPELYVPSVNDKLLKPADILLPLEPQTEIDQLVLTSVDLKHPDKTVDQKSFVSGSSMYYVSTDHIYICETSYVEKEVQTGMARFSYKDGALKAEAAGTVNGRIKDSFCMDEYNGYLRIAATREPGFMGAWRNEQSNSLYVLDKNMKLTGKIEDLAKGERIHSARFMGDSGYFVTYRNVDPLFSVNLKNPEKPEILGELKVTGFSDYMHFYGEDRLLGIGFETDPESGMQ